MIEEARSTPSSTTRGTSNLLSFDGMDEAMLEPPRGRRGWSGTGGMA